MLNHRNRIVARLPKPKGRYWCGGCDQNLNGREKCGYCGYQEDGYYRMKRDIKDLEVEEYIKESEHGKQSSDGY